MTSLGATYYGGCGRPDDTYCPKHDVFGHAEGSPACEVQRAEEENLPYPHPPPCPCEGECNPCPACGYCDCEMPCSCASYGHGGSGPPGPCWKEP